MRPRPTRRSCWRRSSSGSGCRAYAPRVATSQTWHLLRGLRSSPPGLAKSGSRAKLFRAALEQSEQLADAAAVSGFAARPILLYYMVNQAARAVVAARGDSVQVSKHGLKTQNPGASALRDVAVTGDGTGLAGALANALGCETSFGPLSFEVDIGTLWAYLPNCGMWAAQAGLADACALSVDSRVPESTDDAGETVRVSGWPWTVADVRHLRLDDIASRALELVRSRYDVSRGWGIKRTEPSAFFGNMPMLRFDARAGWFSLDFYLEEHHERGPDSTVGEISAWEEFGVTHRLQGEEWVLPTLPGGTRVHPLVAWYAVLFVFSILSRYEPVAWRAHLDVDRSPYAVALQMTLDLALDVVPLLVEDSLRRLVV